MTKFLAPSLAGAVTMMIALLFSNILEQKLIGSTLYLPFPILETLSGEPGILVISILLSLFVAKIFHAFILAYLHEKIPRCYCPMWEKIWRFALLSFFLVYGIQLFMLQTLYLTISLENLDLTVLGLTILNGLCQSFAASAVIVPLLYRVPHETSCKL